MKCGICDGVEPQFTGVVFGRNQICMPCIEKLMNEEIRRNNND
jgi:hypothetical protein